MQLDKIEVHWPRRLNRPAEKKPIPNQLSWTANFPCFVWIQCQHRCFLPPVWSSSRGGTGTNLKRGPESLQLIQSLRLSFLLPLFCKCQLDPSRSFSNNRRRLFHSCFRKKFLSGSLFQIHFVTGYHPTEYFSFIFRVRIAQKWLRSIFCESKIVKCPVGQW